MGDFIRSLCGVILQMLNKLFSVHIYRRSYFVLGEIALQYFVVLRPLSIDFMNNRDARSVLVFSG